MKRRRVYAGIAAGGAAAAAWLAFVCLHSPRLNVLLITLDTTRADRLGCYGYAAAETPALDSLAARGVRFDQAFTQVPLTLPSHATLLTGLCPPEHGLHDNGRGALAANVVSLAPLFRQHGYGTAAFVASFSLDRQFGLAKGFDLYADEMTKAAGDSVLDQENGAQTVADRALAWLDRHAGRPFFCWVHFYDPHTPYDPPEPYRSRHAQPYDGELAYMDSQIRRLVDFVDSRGLRAHTLIVVTGDHGEAFGEHDEFGHGNFVYETTMRVPLLLSLPGRIPEGRSDSRIAGLVDVAGTVLHAAGWRLPSGMRDANLLDAGGPGGRVYGESEFLFNSYGWSPLYSVTTREWKYIQCPRSELYDRIRDPQEQKDLAADDSGRARLLERELKDMRSAFRRAEPAQIALDAEAVAKLRSLGYAAGPAPAAPPEARTRKDPKAMAPVYRACKQAEGLLQSRQPEAALALLTPVLPLSPESKKVHELLIACYTDLGEFAEAEPHVRTCLDMDASDRAMWANLGTVLLEKGQFAEAADVLARTLAMPRNPREPIVGPSRTSKVDVEVRVKLAIAHLHQQNLEKAREQYQAALRHVPGHELANEGLAHIDALEGRNEDAIARMKAMLARSPGLDGVRKNLGVLLCRQKRYGEAIREWREGLKRKPNDPDFLANLAWWLATCPDAGVRNGREAAPLAESACQATGWKDFGLIDILGAAYAEAGEFGLAIEKAKQALQLAESSGKETEPARQIGERLKLYSSAKPYHQP
jgi:arylsulfatase A-like enzyme/Tfp pilus assembly protein PilF